MILGSSSLLRLYDKHKELEIDFEESMQARNDLEKKLDKLMEKIETTRSKDLEL